MRIILLRILVVIVVLFGAVYLWNASWLAPAPEGGRVRVVAHRGVHQNFDLTGVQNDTCTATRIREPIEPVMENTIASMKAAFADGADVVELDVHPTTDGSFAVFHDWTLDCRTNGTGETRSHDMAYLKTLDIGYGYTADGGRSYPLRGTGVGLMPSLTEVLDTFPDGRFLINFKSNEAREGNMLAEKLASNPAWRDAIWGVYGGQAPVDRAVREIEGLRGLGARAARDCLLRYIALGWTGYVPQTCRNSHVMVPVNFTWLIWGWPNRFQARMRSAGSDVILIGPYAHTDAGTSGIDTADTLSEVPADFDGYVWTNEIGTIGPLLDRR